MPFVINPLDLLLLPLLLPLSIFLPLPMHPYAYTLPTIAPNTNSCNTWPTTKTYNAVQWYSLPMWSPWVRSCPSRLVSAFSSLRNGWCRNWGVPRFLGGSQCPPRSIGHPNGIWSRAPYGLGSCICPFLGHVEGGLYLRKIVKRYRELTEIKGIKGIELLMLE